MAHSICAYCIHFSMSKNKYHHTKQNSKNILTHSITSSIHSTKRENHHSDKNVKIIQEIKYKLVKLK